MGCQPTKIGREYVDHGSDITPEVAAALQMKQISSKDFRYWWKLTPGGFRKLQCNLAKLYFAVPIAPHVTVGHVILCCMKPNLTGGLVVLTKDLIFKVQIRQNKALPTGTAGNACCGCCCGGAEWELDLATNTGTAQPGEVLCMPVLKLGGTENPPQFFVHDSMEAQRLIASAKKQSVAGAGHGPGAALTGGDEGGAMYGENHKFYMLRIPADDPAARLATAKGLVDTGAMTAEEFAQLKGKLIPLL